MPNDVRGFCIKEKGLNLSERTFRDMDLMGLSIVGRWTERSATEESNNGKLIELEAISSQSVGFQSLVVQSSERSQRCR